MKPLVEIVLADRGWILEKLAKSILQALEASDSLEISVVDSATGSADLTYFLPYSVQKPVDGSVVGSYFSHQEDVEPAHSNFLERALEADFCVCSARRYQSRLRDAGAKCVELIHLGADRDIFKPKLTVGVVGRTYHTGRKGEALVASVLDLPFVEWRFVGEGWPGQTEHLEDARSMADFYNQIDYLLVPALIEGGPVPPIEALACKCEVIASDVGCMDDLPHISFEHGSADSLRRVLTELYESKSTQLEIDESFDWRMFGRSHVELFEEMLSLHAEVWRSASVEERSTSPENSKIESVRLVCHGSESGTKGGPTIRAGLIAAELESGGVDADVIGSTAAFKGSPLDVVHVFNSWPLASSRKEIENASSISRHVVYSPIALDLGYLPIYSKLVVEALAEFADEPELLTEALSDVPRMCPSFANSDITERPEGHQDHFSALRNSCELADGVVYLSEYEKSFVEGLGCTPRCSVVIQNGVDTSVMADAEPEAFRAQFGLDRYVLIVGRIESRKNQAIVAHALRNLEVNVVCVGHVGDREYFDLVRRVAGRNFLHVDRIENRELLASAYAGCEALILASWCEGAPLVAMEAGAAGARLVLSTMSSEQEYFHGYAQYVHPADVDGIASTIAALCEQPNEDRSADEIHARKEYFRKHFDISRHVDRTLEFYKTVRNQRTPIVDPSPPLIVDATHLAHTLSNSGLLTGVNSLEYELLKELIDSEGATCSVWNSPSRKFYFSFDASDSLGELAGMANTTQPVDQRQFERAHYRLVVDAATNSDTTGRQRTLEVPDSEVNGGGHALRESRWHPARLTKTVAKSALEKLPTSMQRRTVNQIRRFRPQFEHRIEESHRLSRDAIRQRGPELTTHAALAPVMSLNASKSARRFIQVREENYPEIGSRWLVLGQPWISNDRYCEDLLTTVSRRKLSLELVVPDILYITSALSFDLKTRATYERRLTKLASVAKHVYTISDQAQNELESFRDSRGLTFGISRFCLGLPETPATSVPVAGLVPGRFVVYVSSFNGRKNQDFLIQVWREARKRNRAFARDFTLLLVGNVQAGSEQFRQEEVLSFLRDENISVLSGVGDSELGWLYENCAFTAYPSISEGWGFPIQESLEYGKVCIANDSIPAVVETSCAAILPLPVSDFDGWVEKVLSLASNPDLRAALESHADAWEAASWKDCASVVAASAVSKP